MLDPTPAVAFVMLVALIVYTLSGGADFGGGVWDLLASGPRARQQRKLISHAIAPIWEANHVWLIVVVVLMFVCFPPAFAAVSTALHIPLTLMLIGVVLRGAAFVFRAYDPANPDEAGGPWQLVFAVSSTLTPVMLGIVLGAMTSGAMRIDAETQLVQTDFVSEWLAPFPVLVGLYGLALCALLAAVYLIEEAEGDPEMQDDFRRRGLSASVATGVLAFATLGAAHSGAPHLFSALVESTWAIPLHVATGVFATGAIGALSLRRHRLARVLVILQTVGIFAGFGAAQWPWILPPDLSFHAAAGPPNVLNGVLAILAGGAVLLLPAFAWLMHIFKGRPATAR